MSSKKKFCTSSKNLDKSPPGKSLEEMKQARRRPRWNAFLKPIITLTPLVASVGLLMFSLKACKERFFPISAIRETLRVPPIAMVANSFAIDWTRTSAIIHFCVSLRHDYEAHRCYSFGGGAGCANEISPAQSASSSGGKTVISPYIRNRAST